MLIQFYVENYRSIWSRQTLSMVASSYFKELELLNTFETGDKSVPRLLRSSAIYGPNASGKSTLVLALDFMRNLVINSAKESQAEEEIPVQPFKLASAARQGDSEFEVTFIEDSVRYQYGFRCNKKKITEEWLIAYPAGRPQRWFHRVSHLDANTNKDEYRFGSAFSGGRKRHDWKDQTRPNALFLSTSLQLNNEQLKPVLSWFQKRLQVIEEHRFPTPEYTMTRCREEGQKRKVLEFLNSADLSISDFRIDTREFTSDFLPEDMPIALRDELSKTMAGKEVMKATFFHEDIETNEPIQLTMSEESDGTRALFAFAGRWIDVLEKELVLVVDELDTSLHPLIVHYLVKLLHHTGRKAQIIFTTHDTTILSQKSLRRDQIWFMEKNAKNSSHLYPLSDFSPRDNEAVERGYLNGRYGGIPFLKDLDFYGQ